MIEIKYVNHNAREELESLPVEMGSRFKRIIGMINEFGIDKVGMPHIRYLISGLWEIRIKDSTNQARVIYVRIRDDGLLICNTFIKKEQKTPRREIDKALKRLKEYEMIEKNPNADPSLDYYETQKKWEKNPEFQLAYEKLEPEFNKYREKIIARMARKSAKLAQNKAKKHGKTHPIIHSVGIISNPKMDTA